MRHLYRSAYQNKSLSWEGSALIGSLLWVLREVNFEHDLEALAKSVYELTMVSSSIKTGIPLYVA